MRFGPGATTNVNKKKSCPRIKLGERLACSEDLQSQIDNLAEEVPDWFSLHSHEGVSTVEVHYGSLSFVPKTFKASRCIVTEPVLNSFVQLGIGDYITERLRRAGLDLSTQEQKNKNAARIGSLTGELATLDLSSASDTVSKGIVEHLLPFDWVNFLSDFRTGSIRLPDGSVHFLNKFSSMGNGFTFPLETLIFYSLAWACSGSDKDAVCTYGDDIIVPTHAVALLKKVLLCAGFLLNVDKSFDEGPFRESCGGDYLKGIDIRPVYVKDRLSCADAFRLHNYFVAREQHDAATSILEAIDPSVRIFGPKGFGDGHLIGDWKPSFKSKHKLRGYGGATFETYKLSGNRLISGFLPGDSVLPSYVIYTSSISEVDDDLRPYFERIRARSHGTLRMSTPHVVHRKMTERGEKWGVSIPGTKGYARISIYLLNPWAYM